MKLRSHPLMCHRGIPSWPPVWTREFGQETYPAGEVGILQDVRRSTDGNYCYLAIQHNGSRYLGFLECDDCKFFEKVYRLFSRSCGHAIQEIGELDLDPD
jgi:hypothetical protein